jgi:hypothetical protein
LGHHVDGTGPLASSYDVTYITRDRSIARITICVDPEIRVDSLSVLGQSLGG